MVQDRAIVTIFAADARFVGDSHPSCLLRCSRYSEARSVMKYYIMKCVLLIARNVMLTDSVLLASAWDNSITKKEDREIKDALFQFLKTVHRKV